MSKKWNPGMLSSVSGAYWYGCTLQAAVRLQFFTGLASGGRTANELSLQLECAERPTELLLNGLAAMGLLVKNGSLYTNSEEAQELLVVSSPKYMGHIILHHHHILDGWAQLDTVVKTGEPVKKRSHGKEIERESFLMGMFNIAMGIAPEIARKIDLSSRMRLLDLGGGPGTYAIQFCLAHPELKAVIFDRPTTEPFARATAQRFEVSDRIDFVGGDFTTDPIEVGEYDVAWLSHILHSNSYEQCEDIIAKTVDSMADGGLILVHDFILDDSKDGPVFPALFSLNMLVANTDGRAYSKAEIGEMLTKAGVEAVEHHDFCAPNDSSILYGIKG